MAEERLKRKNEVSKGFGLNPRFFTLVRKRKDGIGNGNGISLKLHLMNLGIKIKNNYSVKLVNQIK